MTAVAIQQSIPTSRYVKRCARCRTVRGNSSFYQGARHGRDPSVCRFCHDQTQNTRKVVKELRSRIRELTTMRERERRLANELERVRRQIRTREDAMIALEQSNLFAT